MFPIRTSFRCRRFTPSLTGLIGAPPKLKFNSHLVILISLYHNLSTILASVRTINERVEVESAGDGQDQASRETARLLGAEDSKAGGVEHGDD